VVESVAAVQSALEGRFSDLRARLVESLGSDTVDLVLERGVREVAGIYPGFRLSIDNSGYLRLDWEADPVASHSQEFIRNAYSALYAAMLVILARILGREIAVRLAAAVDAERVLQGHPLD
jgi:hypothetical protein